MDPNFASAHFNLSVAYQDMGKYDLWLQEWEKYATAANDREDLAVAEDAARVYRKSGYQAALRQIIAREEELAKRRYVDPGSLAYWYAELNDRDQTFRWLERAYSEKAESLQVIQIVRPMDRYRSDPRYVDLLKRMGLPQ